LSISQQELETYDPMEVFTYALKAPESRRQYPRRFKPFLDFLKLEGSLNEQAKQFYSKAREDLRWAEDILMQFIRYQKERAASGEISESTVPNYYRATKLFCEMNDITLNWRKIARGLPRARDAANDRAPTLEEIRKLVQYPDRRIKPIVFLMASSGIRIGAFDYLQWKHIVPIYNESNEIVAAKITVYAGDNEQYYFFTTPEAYNSIKDWTEFRKKQDEPITGNSYLMRDIWNTGKIVINTRNMHLCWIVVDYNS
jgi:hypothetical protein